MPWLELVGWLGSGVLIYSLMQARVLRFRVLNLIGCVLLTGFNAVLGIWPMVAMNVVLSVINIWHIRLLLRTRHDTEAYDVLEVGLADQYLRHLVQVHEPDILAHQPDFTWDTVDDASIAYLVVRGDETVGVVLVHPAGEGVAQVVLDYVTPRFRDFSPGEFVWRRSNALRDRGFSRVVTPAHMVSPYYARVGFRPVENGAYELDL